MDVSLVTKGKNQLLEIQPVSLSDFERYMNDTCTVSWMVSTLLERNKENKMNKEAGPFVETTTYFHVPLKMHMSALPTNKSFIDCIQDIY